MGAPQVGTVFGSFATPERTALRLEEATRYVAINLDIAEGDPEWSGLTYGPFDTYDEAVDYGNATIQFFAVNELIEPIGSN